jgi:DNA-binding MarR family transcriptional regulator
LTGYHTLTEKDSMVKDLADQFNVDRMTVSNVINGRTWREHAG